MSDKRLVDVYYEDFPRWAGLINERVDILWAEHEANPTIPPGEVWVYKENDDALADALVALTLENKRLEEANNTLTADVAALRAKNEALEKRLDDVMEEI